MSEYENSNRVRDGESPGSVPSQGWPWRRLSGDLGAERWRSLQEVQVEI
jgi:hypothetical protein